MHAKIFANVPDTGLSKRRAQKHRAINRAENAKKKKSSNIQTIVRAKKKQQHMYSIYPMK